MGNRSCAAKQAPGGYNDSIVPDQDPLLRSTGSVTRRIVRAEVSKDFEILPQVLGTGYSGAVHRAEHRNTKQQVAVKKFSKRRLKPHRVKLLQSEVEVYLRLDHPNVCRLLHAYEGKKHVWLIMEICGCELYRRLCERKVYSESDAADVMRQMLQAVNYLHSHNIVHRDLKLENWMYSEQEHRDDDRLKLIDFGFSRILHDAAETLDMPCGTLHYSSPEVLARKYTSQCDLWSMGVICYMLLTGKPPFRGSDNLKVARSILTDEFAQDGCWAQLSDEAKDFLRRLLQKDATRRMTASQSLTHDWFKRISCAAPCDIGVEVLKSLRVFATGSHLRRAALTMLAYSLTSKELQELEQTFLDFDRSGRGTITLDQLRDAMQEHLEVSSEEVRRIFQKFDYAESEEIHYTPFVAALLAARVRLHEDKVRTAFETFDREGKGYITAETLVQIFSDHLSCNGNVGLSKDEAEQWIREVDYKGNGVIDYSSFLAALTGRRLWALPSLEEVAEQPTVKVFEEASRGGRPRGLSDGTLCCDAVRGRVQHCLASVIIDGADDEQRAETRAQSFTAGVSAVSAKVEIRSLVCDLDERYFMSKAM
eukprot:TRINITY_DN3632_c0_g1_i1.p1 TRINITY_DN3632_c0_g1~~TRINITY_DN3632_c0_g1_i1.p1  ORF type:complete len:593 (+),score=113.61 TRINITY_DN3632_c0_g1_i1:44-1822(+)